MPRSYEIRWVPRRGQWSTALDASWLHQILERQYRQRVKPLV